MRKVEEEIRGLDRGQDHGLKGGDTATNRICSSLRTVTGNVIDATTSILPGGISAICVKNPRRITVKMMCLLDTGKNTEMEIGKEIEIEIEIIISEITTEKGTEITIITETETLTETKIIAEISTTIATMTPDTTTPDTTLNSPPILKTTEGTTNTRAGPLAQIPFSQATVPSATTTEEGTTNADPTDPSPSRPLYHLKPFQFYLKTT